MNDTTDQEEQMECDVLIVGAGPAGLSAAIRLAQAAQDAGTERTIMVLEKGSEVGAHLLSGAVLEPRALSEFFPDWRDMDAPLDTEVREDHFMLLTKDRAFHLPVPPQMKGAGKGNYIISLGQFCRWLASQAEALGVQIFPGFSGHELIIEEEKVVGVRTGAFGIGADGSRKDSYQPPMQLRAAFTLLAEGVRGSLSQQLIARYDLRRGKQPQTYGIGLKEVWEINEEQHQPGSVLHSVGWPLDHATYGGSFLYHWSGKRVSVGFVAGLDYTNPYFDPYETFQTFKTHPAIAPIFEGGKRISYGARALNEGGWQSVPHLSVPGAALIGCSAGFVNVTKIKGIHTAMKTGIMAADAAHALLAQQESHIIMQNYQEAYDASWVAEELYAVRNIRPGFHYGLLPGLAYAALDTYLLRGKAPWTFGHRQDHKSLKHAQHAKPYDYAKHDGTLTFDKLDSVYLTNTNHAEDQPCHLHLKDDSLPIAFNLSYYDNPETRYCPAGVYEVVTDDAGEAAFQINAQNCIHCKTCDIKDPRQNIVWRTPEGGGGPNYTEM